MKLESFKDKKVTRRKMILISLGVITLIGISLLLYKTFASFSEEVSFPMMSGKVNYYGNADLIFVFYKGDEQLDEMPQKGNSDNLVFDYGICDNDATIEWNEEKWAPLVKGLNKTKTRCSLYFKEYKIPTLRQVTSTDENGMWQYKDRLTKIVIENEKSKKEYTAEQNAYGPFDESSTKDRAVESYVVYNFTNKTWTGYLQGDGKIKLNSDSSYLFSDLKNVTEIEGIENLDTSSVTNMNHMFYNMSQLQSLTFGDNFDTSSVTDMSFMFGGYNNFWPPYSYGNKLSTLNLSSFDTSNVTDMSYMFSEMRNLQTLTFGDNFDTSSVTNMDSMFVIGNQNSNIVEDKLSTLNLSSFDTSSVTNMSYMFYNRTNLNSITYGSNFIHNIEATTFFMFDNCPANKPDATVHSSWSGVSFD